MKNTKILSLLELNRTKSIEQLIENKPEKISFPAVLKELDINNFTPPSTVFKKKKIHNKTFEFFNFKLIHFTLN